ncbi:hypothetical protein MKW98_025212 [Papaver atlanticum]|uniref:Uncharacterized protein n=1 Tax=Papaver atlanticum TaxID=357466 RepID=A0AAD4S1R3_9MAGN|nr:hypothetical protein MKW98_025212 [Papaver atlanticum]
MLKRLGEGKVNDTPPAEIRAATALVECIQQGGGRSGILLQPLAPPPLTIDLEAIDDEVVTPRSFAEPRRNKARRNLEILITAERPAPPPPPPPPPCDSKHYLSPYCKIVPCNGVGNRSTRCAPKSLPKEAAFSCPVCMSSLVEPTSTKWGHIFCKHMYYRRISIHRVFISTKPSEYELLS